MLLSLKHLQQGPLGGNHLLNQWQREKNHVQVYPTSHQYGAMSRHPSLSTFSVHNNQ